MAGIYVMLWPVFTGEQTPSSARNGCAGVFSRANEPEQQYPELLAALQEYNRQLYAESSATSPTSKPVREPAADLTTYGIEDEIIGVLEIPAMELTMPIYLGASDAHLAAGATVLGNTSAPIGGDNTNCVIAGHRGWKGADYFRHIDKLAVGDTVRLTNLWETLTYTVADIQIIQPHQIRKNQNSIKPRPADAVDLPSLRQRWAAAVCGVLREGVAMKKMHPIVWAILCLPVVYFAMVTASVYIPGENVFALLERFSTMVRR